MSEHHNIDPYPIPRDVSPRYINEPWLVDESIYYETYEDMEKAKLPDEVDDNIRLYIPMDLNKEAILRRLDYVIYKYEEATEENELKFSSEVGRIIHQIEIYDQIWFIRHTPKNKEQRHSDEAIELVKEFVAKLESIPDGCAECFTFEEIELLREEYL